MDDNNSISRPRCGALLGIGLLAAAAVSTPALAETYVNPDGQRVECHYEEVATKDGHPVAGPLAGAVVGGVVGHQFGSGSGNKAATAAGAVGGAVAGKKIDENRTEKSVETRKVCRPID
jgi:uncharacterized protein YcfJ